MLQSVSLNGLKLYQQSFGSCIFPYLIARWDEIQYQGWKRLGIPTSVRLNHKDGEELDMNANIRDILRSGDHVHIETSIPPSLVK